MKLGTENRNKTIAAIALAIVGIGTLVYQLSGFSSSSPEPAPAPPAVTEHPAATVAPAPSRPANPARTDRRSKGPRLVIVNSLDPTIRLDLLKAAEDQHYSSNGRNIFEAHAPEPPQPKIDRTKMHPPINPNPQPPPQIVQGPPPINLKFYGWASKPGQPKRIFLSQGEEVFVASEGDLVANRYKVVHINSGSVEIEDILNNNRQTIPMS